MWTSVCCFGERLKGASPFVSRTNSTQQEAQRKERKGKKCIFREEELASRYIVDWSEKGLLGAGHFAQVYRGVSTFDNKPVALKRISRAGQSDKTLQTEVEALLLVKGHPNIVSLYEVFIGRERVFLAMELLEGGELFQRIVDNGAYSESNASIHLGKIAKALLHMHSQGIVHRDLKPENLVLATKDPNSEIKISDFGLSKILEKNQVLMATVCGTNAYAAPEIGLSASPGEEHYDAKVDMWSLGVIMYVLLVAYHPFDPEGRSDQRTMRERIRRYDWNMNDKVWNNISDQAKDLLHRLLCSRDKRLDAAQFLQHEWITAGMYGRLSKRPLKEFSDRSLGKFISKPNGINIKVGNPEQNGNHKQISQN